VSYAILVPNVEKANESNLSSVWLDKQGDATALVFGKGEIAILMAPWKDVDSPEAVFEQDVATMHAKTRVETINGDDALVIEPDTDIDASDPAWIELAHDGVDINIESSAYGTDVLLDVARSLTAASS